MNPYILKKLRQTYDSIGVTSRASVDYSVRTDTYNFDFEKFQLQIKNIFDKDALDEKQLMDFLSEIFVSFGFLLSEVETLQNMYDTLSYARFLEADSIKRHIERLNQYVVYLEDYIGIQPTSADEHNELTVGEKE